jgi:transcriptional regulator with XRE-family HTH domain
LVIDLADFIQQRQAQLNLTDAAVAELADIDLDVYLRYKHGDVRKVHTTTVARLATALQIDSSELLRVAGVRRRRSRSEAGVVKSPRGVYVLSSLQADPSTPEDFAALMLNRAAQLDDQAETRETEARSLLAEAQRLRDTATDLRKRANAMLALS